MATAPPPQLERSTIEFLRKYAPFNEMEADALRLVAGRAKLGYYAKGTQVVGPQAGVARTLFIVQRDAVHSRPAATGAAVTFSTARGCSRECAARCAAARRYESAADLFCYELDRGPARSCARERRSSISARGMDGLLQQAPPPAPRL
jgi:CBS domain-containing protein